MKAKHVLWYLDQIRVEAARSHEIFLRLRHRDLSEEEVKDLIDSNGKMLAYERLMREYVEFEMTGLWNWRQRR
jgi:hypothetical protein